MQEYKHTDVFYVNMKPTKNFKEKSVDHSEVAQSTEIYSDHIDQTSKQGIRPLGLETDLRELNLYRQTGFRFFSLYFYKIKITYAGKVFDDQFLLERDSISDDFFELYVRDLLSTRLQDYFVTYHEANSKLKRYQGNGCETAIPTV